MGIEFTLQVLPEDPTWLPKASLVAEFIRAIDTSWSGPVQATFIDENVEDCPLEALPRDQVVTSLETNRLSEVMWFDVQPNAPLVREHIDTSDSGDDVETDRLASPTLSVRYGRCGFERVHSEARLLERTCPNCKGVGHDIAGWLSSHMLLFEGECWECGTRLDTDASWLSEGVSRFAFDVSAEGFVTNRFLRINPALYFLMCRLFQVRFKQRVIWE